MKGIEAKVVILGSKGVGKTSLCKQYIKSKLYKENEGSMAVCFFTCTIALDDSNIKLQIWDTAGQERFRAVAPMYYRNANAAILVFDLTQYHTFQDIKSWILELHRNVQTPLVLALVGNKSDLLDYRTVQHEEAYKFATSIGAHYFETSVKADQGLEQAFVTTALGIIRLANEGKCPSLRKFNSKDSQGHYTKENTAYSHMKTAIVNCDTYDGCEIILHLPLAVPTGIHVESDQVKTDGEGRLESPSRSIDYIAWGEEVSSATCC